MLQPLPSIKHHGILRISGIVCTLNHASLSSERLTIIYHSFGLCRYLETLLNQTMLDIEAAETRQGLPP